MVGDASRQGLIVPLIALARAFGRIGLLGFGGPAGQIALMHAEIVDRRGWVDEGEYLHALNFCALLPGPEAQQLATWIGWRLRGTAGGIIAGLMFLLPGAAIMLGLSLAYVAAAGTAWIGGVLLGLKAAVVAIVLQALVRIGSRSLDTPFRRLLAVAAFAALFAFALPFPLVIAAAALAGAIAARARPGWIGLAPAPVHADAADHPPGSVLLARAGSWLALWLAPMVLVAATLGKGHALWDIGAFFGRMAVVTFGGAYAVLSYVAQEAVQGFGWLSAGEMADALALAETTPGPLILVTQQVGFLAGYRAAGPLSPLLGGIAGAGLTTWMTFVPSFFLVMMLAPWMERLRASPRAAGALAGVMAAVVGVIANLSVWFAMHVLFTRVGPWAAGPLRLSLPDPASLDPAAFALTLLASALLLGLRWSVPRVLAAAVLAGLIVTRLT